jgi:hypothetical protein
LPHPGDFKQARNPVSPVLHGTGENSLFQRVRVNLGMVVLPVQVFHRRVIVL